MDKRSRGSTGLSEAIARESGSNFLYAFLFLPKEQRTAIRTLYAFARRLDDCVDEVRDPEQARHLIAQWKQELERCYRGQPVEPAMQELAPIIQRFSIPREPFEELIRGCEMDLEKNRYETFDELRQYCYRVASAVGLLCLPIFGCRSTGAEQYAIHLGLALQLTNILRDVGSDAARGRVYLPQEDLRRFGYTTEMLMGRTYNEAFQDLMRFEAERAADFYRQAQCLLPKPDRRRLIAARIMGRIYRALLDKIMRQEYQVFHTKITLGKAQRFRLALWTYLGLGEKSTGITG